MSFYPYEFRGILTLRDLGRYTYKVLYLPDELAARLPLDVHPRLRITGEIAEVPMEAAWQPSPEGRYIMVAPQVIRAAGLAIGDLVEMRFSIADQDAVQVPHDLAPALAEHEDLSAAWEALSPGRRRALSHHIGSAKTDATRSKRIATVLDLLTDEDAMRRFFRKG